MSVATAVLVLAPLAPAQSRRINGPLVLAAAGDVRDYELTSSGAGIVYRADQEKAGVLELYAVPAAGGTSPVRLNDPLPIGRSVGSYAIADSGRVVFEADQTIDNVIELFSVPFDRSTGPVRLHAPLPANGDVGSFQLHPDGQTVVFSVHSPGGAALQRGPLDGSAPPIVLTGTIDLANYWISPAGERVVFGVRNLNREQLFSVPSDGSAAPIPLAMSSVPGSFVYSTRFRDVRFTLDGTRAVVQDYYDHEDEPTADLLALPLDGSQAPLQINLHTQDGWQQAPFLFDGLSRVVYLAPTDLFSVADLFAVDIDGTNHVQLDPPASHARGFGFTPGGQNVVFGVDGTTDALFRAPIDGSTSAVQLVANAASILQFEFPDPARLVYSEVTGPSGSTLWSYLALPLAGGAPLLLNPPPFGGAAAFQIRPDGQELAFTRNDAGVKKLCAAPLDASQAPRDLSSLAIASGNVNRFSITADSARVVYLADALIDEAFELFGVRFDGSGIVKYNPLLGPVLSGDVLAFQAAPAVEHVVYRADQDQDEVFELYAAPADGRGAPRKLSPVLPSGADVSAFAVSPSGEHTVFQHGLPGSVDLSATSTTEIGPMHALDGPGLEIQGPFLFDDSGTRVVYRREAAPGGAFALRSALLDGSAPAVRIDGLGTGSVLEFQLVPGGADAVYLSTRVGIQQLYVTPLDGSAPAVRLHPPMRPAADVTAFALSPDGARAIFLADTGVDQRFDLWSVPLDVIRLPKRVNDRLVAGGAVTGFAFTPDGRSVLYRADQRFDGRFELFLAPSDGRDPARREDGEPPQPRARLLTPLEAGRSVQADFALEGRTVLFRADADTAGTIELWRVGVDGSAPPLRLSGPLVAGGDVSSFALAPDGSRVVYLADQRADGVIEPFSVAFAGGPALALDTLPPAADVQSFRIAPDASVVVYRANRASPAFELFAVPLDGSRAPKRLNGPLASGGEVQADFVALSGGRALFRADQDSDGVFELFESGPQSPWCAALRTTRTRLARGVTACMARGAGPWIRSGP